MRILTLLIIILAIGCQRQGGGNDENAVFAVVNGKEIKGKQILDRVKGDLAELEKNVYEIKRRALEEIIQQTILEEEAKKQGATPEKLLSQFDAIRDKEVSKTDITQFLKQRNLTEKDVKKEERAAIPKIIAMQRVYEAKQKYVNEIRSKANVQIKLKRPSEKPVEVGTGSGSPKGGSGAKVTIVEFSDFQCPYCARGRTRLNEIAAKYGDKVRIYFRHFPLTSIHPQAFKASEASICAQDQGKFWEYHDLLFDHQDKLGESELPKYAKDVGLDVKTFEECLRSGKHAADVRKDMEEGMKIGVNSTPSFFVNGYNVRGAQPLESFAEIIDEQLSK